MNLHELIGVLGMLENDNICAGGVGVYINIDGCSYDILDISIHKHYNQTNEDKIVIDIIDKEI